MLMFWQVISLFSIGVHGELLIANGIMYLDRLDTMRENM